MVIPVEVCFRNMHPSEAIEAVVRERAAKLDRFHPHIVSCRVVIEAAYHRHAKGAVFHVRVDVAVPRHEIVTESEPPPQHFHDDVYVAVRDAFDEARRALQDDARRRRGDVKSHAPRPLARVTRLYPDRGFGFLETAEGVEMYFHEHSVLGAGFATLAVGDEVRFDEEAGEKGPQASTVEAVGRPGHDGGDPRTSGPAG